MSKTKKTSGKTKSISNKIIQKSSVQKVMQPLHVKRAGTGKSRQNSAAE